MISKEDIQNIYINLDDSGKLVNNEKVTVYAGTVFLSKSEKDKFVTQYRMIVESIKCKYSKGNVENCDKTCPELKHNMLDSKHIRHLINYIKKYSLIACIIENDEVYESIKLDTASRGRFLDYSIKLMIKNTVECLIKEGKIDSNKPVRIILNIDEQTTKSNGYYNLKDGIIEELRYGIINYDYGMIHKPILSDSLEVEVHYKESKKSYLIQACDLVAGRIRKLYLQSEDFNDFLKKSEFVKYKIFLPKKKSR